MDMTSPDIATIQALRGDVARQIARYAQRVGASQLVAAKQLGIPQPTLSKIINGHVSDISLELLIRSRSGGSAYDAPDRPSSARSRRLQVYCSFAFDQSPPGPTSELQLNNP